MKTGIHPNYVDSQVVCSCGHVFSTRSTKVTITIDVCAKCHPFFTGEQRFLDTKGRVEEFQKKQQFATTMKPVLEAKKAKKAGKATSGETKSLRDLLAEV